MPAPKRDRFRRGSPEWIRLGEQLAARRGELGAEYGGHGGRLAFARDRLPPTPGGNVNTKLAEDIELNHRENFTPLTLRDVIAPAWGVTFASLQDVLDSPDADLEAAPGTPPRRRRRPPLEALPGDGARDETPVPAALARLGPVSEDFYAGVDADPAPRDEWERAVWDDPSPVPLSQRRHLVAWHRSVAAGEGRQRAGGLSHAAAPRSLPDGNDLS